MNRQPQDIDFAVAYRILAIIGVVVLALLAPAACQLRAESNENMKTDARQDERMTAIEKREEMLRTDLSEIKADVKTLVRREGK